MRFQLFGTNGCYNGANGHKCDTKHKKPSPYTHQPSEIYPQALPHPLFVMQHPSIYTDMLSHSHYPLLRTKLASLVKGRWIDGKAQTVVLLRFNCDTPAFFIRQTFLPPRRRDCPIPPSMRFSALSLSLFVGEWACPSRCTNPCHSHNHCKRTITPRSAPTLPKPHYPTLCAITLAF